MILVRPKHEIMAIMGVDNPDDCHIPLQLIERAGRTCYKSEKLITEDSSKKFIETIIKSGHHSVIEHSALTVKFICDRGVTHELVRHRLCAFSQESTRYCNYKGGVTFVIPPWCKDLGAGNFTIFDRETQALGNNTVEFVSLLLHAEETYKELLDNGWSPQQARSVLPNSLKTEIVVTANFREWRHIFNLRCSKSAHPQMREIMIPLLGKVKNIIPVIFDDITF